MEFYKMINCFCSYIIKPAGETTKKVLLSVIRNLILIEIHLSQIRISDSKRKKVYAVCPYILFYSFSPTTFSFHHFSTLISFISFHFIRACDGVLRRIHTMPISSVALQCGIGGALFHITEGHWRLALCGSAFRRGRLACVDETYGVVGRQRPSIKWPFSSHPSTRPCVGQEFIFI